MIQFIAVKGRLFALQIQDLIRAAIQTLITHLLVESRDCIRGVVLPRAGQLMTLTVMAPMFVVLCWEMVVMTLKDQSRALHQTQNYLYNPSSVASTPLIGRLPCLVVFLR